MILRILPLLVVATSAASAQANRTVVQVTDTRGNAIAFALVQIENGVERIANDSGRASFDMKPKDSLRLQVRRIGFEPFVGWAKRSPDHDAFIADLLPLAQALDPVTIRELRDTPLSRTGFYDRAQRVQRGAVAARMITPEELELRNPIRLSQMLTGDRFIKVAPMRGRQVLLGRGPNCAMTILLDGQRLDGTYEEAINNPQNPPPLSSLAAVDDVISIGTVAAIEIYGSVAQAPVELQRQAGAKAGCGLVAIWTGRRR